LKSKRDILRFIGLAMRAGKVVSGYDASMAELKAGRGELIIISKDISTNTLDSLMNLAERYEGEFPGAFSFASMSELGTAIGRPDRAILVITDKGFADKLTEMFEDYEDTEEDS